MPVRDRQATSARSLDAARKVLAEEGFQKLGINLVARRAGCDKQLIYRYFGGMDGLIDAIAADIADWARENISPDGSAFLLTYGDLIERLVVQFMEALRDDKLMQKIVAWELAEDSPRVRRFSESRSRALKQWIDQARGGLQPPKASDAGLLNALLLAAAQTIVLSAANSGEFAGASISRERDWQRMTAAMRKLVRGVYP
jgi:AcrR family transcriptional regulator